MVVCPHLNSSSWTRQVSQFIDRAVRSSTHWQYRMHQDSHFEKPTCLDVKGYRHCSSVWPCVLSLCPDSRAEYVFPLCLPILMIFFFLTVSHKWGASSLQWSSFVERGSTSSTEAKVSHVLLDPESQKQLNGMIILAHGHTVGEKITLTLKCVRPLLCSVQF